jgi:hypothetical protein
VYFLAYPKIVVVAVAVAVAVAVVIQIKCLIPPQNIIPANNKE